MKITLLCAFTLMYFCNCVLGQVNKFNDEKADEEKGKRFIVDKKIKEIDHYLMIRRNNAFTNDSDLICRMFYNKQGDLIKIIKYSKRFSQATSSDVDVKYVENYNQSYNTKGQVIKMVSENNIAFNYHSVDTYQYDANGALVKQSNINNIVLVPSKAKNGGGSTVYSRDTHGNVIWLKRIDFNGLLYQASQYLYSEKNELFKILYFRSDTTQTTHHDEYTYLHTASGLVKLESSFDQKNVLFHQNEYDYDLHGNLSAMFEIVNGLKKPVIQFKYNQSNQLTESVGKVPNNAHFSDQDLRRGKPSHLRYFYDNEGRLCRIEKYEMNKKSSAEEISSIEKINY